MGGLEGPPKPPECSERPGGSRGAPLSTESRPNSPERSERPGSAVALLCLPKGPTPGKDCRSQESFFLSCQRPGAVLSHRRQPAMPARGVSVLVVGDDEHTWGDAPG